VEHKCVVGGEEARPDRAMKSAQNQTEFEPHEEIKSRSDGTRHSSQKQHPPGLVAD